MLTCPMCKKPVRGLVKECPSCRADLGLLLDYVETLDDGLARAEARIRAGQLGPAVWAYLEVLEVDPDNPVARQQVGQVVTAVRQFDRAAPRRRWLERLRRQELFSKWLTSVGESQPDGTSQRWLRYGSLAALALMLLGIGFASGYLGGRSGPVALPASVSR
jgi:hypothetical protein